MPINRDSAPFSEGDKGDRRVTVCSQEAGKDC